MASGFVQIPVALVASGLVGLVIGAISLRTRGVYFIMITLAFAQMLYFLGVGVEYYGADDGLTLYSRSEFAGLFDLFDASTLYYFCFVSLLVTLYISHRLINSRFGMAIRSIKANERRTQAIGIPSYRYRLTCFVIAAVICGFAGFLLANRTDFVSPAMMHWTRSGDLIIMVVLGGMGTLFGPLLGTVGFLLLEEILSGYTEFWQLYFGPLLILIVIFGRGGIDGLLQALSNIGRKTDDGPAAAGD
jgi:branched-chain amino acid transport system permease protein